MRNLDISNNKILATLRELPVKPPIPQGQEGKIGYIVAWLLGVPVWILLLVFLIKG